MKIAKGLRSSSVDPIAGWTFIVAEVAHSIWFAVETVIRPSRLPPGALAYYQRHERPLWASLTGDLINLAVVIVIGLGIVRGRAWALWIQALVSLRFAFDETTRPPHGAPDPYIIASFGLGVLMFAYAGLRILGIVGDGPRPLFRRVVSET